ncbi:hypothetical protein QUA07_05310 [Microcoleus sp. T3_A4]|uniref:hypothetical protein n=1 Tax=Microcoleus sp. T3_A4 TaxID=2818968 RepID=UPI002FD28E56
MDQGFWGLIVQVIDFSFLSGDRGTIALCPQRLHATGRFLQAHSTSDRPPDGPHPNCCPKRVSPNLALVME